MLIIEQARPKTSWKMSVGLLCVNRIHDASLLGVSGLIHHYTITSRSSEPMMLLCLGSLDWHIITSILRWTDPSLLQYLITWLHCCVDVVQWKMPAKNKNKNKMAWDPSHKVWLEKTVKTTCTSKEPGHTFPRLQKHICMSPRAGRKAYHL